MPSSISDLDLIDERYPEAGVNQSSQPFRTNFATIKNNLLSAQSDLNELFATTITIGGDMATTPYSSSITFYDAARTSNNNLNLEVYINKMPGLVSGTYETKDHDVSFSVDDRGMLTSVEQTDKETFNVVGVHDVKLDHYYDVTDYAASKLTVPVFTVDKYGRVIAVTEKQLGGFGFRGQPVNRGDILVGQGILAPANTPDGVLNTMPIKIGKPGAPYIFDPWEINVLRIKNTSAQDENPLIWSDISNLARGGTLRVINGVEGIMATPSLVNPLDLPLKSGTADTYTLSLDINGLEEFAGTSNVDTADYIPIYDGSSTKVFKIKASKFLLSAGTGTKYIEWAKPELGGELDVHGFAITTKYGNLDLRVDAIGQLRFNGQTWPKLRGTDGQVLVTDGQGILRWQSLEQTSQGSVTGISTGTGLQTSTFTTITESGSIMLAFQNLPTTTNIDSDIYVPVVSTTTNEHKKIKAADLSIKTTRSFFVNSASGFDTNDGSIGSPFRTISAAINTIPVGGENYTIYVWPGRYEENVAITKPNVTIKGLSSYKDILITGYGGGPAVRITNDLFNTTLSNISIDTRSTCSYDIDTNTAVGVTTALMITGGHNIFFENCGIMTLFNPTDSLNSPTKAISIVTTIKGQIVFRNCDIMGVVENLGNYNGLVDSTDPNVDTDVFYPVLFDGNVYSNNYPPAFIIGDNSDPDAGFPYTIINNYSSISAIKHVAGTIALNNVLNIADTIESTATYASTNKLILKNVSLRASGFGGSDFSTTAETYSKINKTGTCEYEFCNVDRNPSIDVLNGNRLNYGGVKSVDIASTSISKTISGNETLDLHQSDVWDLTLTQDSVLTLTFSNFASNSIPTNNLSNSNIFNKTFTLVAKQDSTGNRNLSFLVPSSETIIWNNSDTQPPISKIANSQTIFEFLKIGNTWYGERKFVKKDSTIQETVLISSGTTYSMVPPNKIILVRKTIDGAMSIVLPDTSLITPGYQVTVKDTKGKATSYPITISCNGPEKIDANLTWVINSTYGYKSFIWTGYEWSSV